MTEIVFTPPTVEYYTNLITWEHQKPKFLAMIGGLVEAYVGVNALIASLPQAFDIDTAVGAQLDIVGQWVGHSRVLTTALPNVYFCWDATIMTDAGPEPSGPTGWDEGSWFQEYLPTTTYVVLDDDHYRILLKGKIVANYWDGTIPHAYEAWDTIFAPEGYHIIIQNGQADAIEEFYWDDYVNIRHGWDYAGWAVYLTWHTNFIRNSKGVGATILGSDFPTYWSHYGNWLPVILELNVVNGIDMVHFAFQSNSLFDESYIWFEEPGIVTLHFSELRNRTFSLYVRQYYPLEEVTHLYLEIVAYDENDLQQEVASVEIFPDDTEQRFQVTWIYDNSPTDKTYVRPRLRLTHPVLAELGRYDLAVGGAQIEMGNYATSWITTDGQASVEYIRPPVVPKVNGGMHMIYGLIAPYQAPPPGVDIPPSLDAVTMALFTGGHLDLRPAGVTVEYCIQSLVGTPFFAWDVATIGSIIAPPTSVAGWEIGAWPNFVVPVVPDNTTLTGTTGSTSRAV